MPQAIERLFFYILTYSFLLPIIFFFIFFKKLKSNKVAIAVVIYSIIIFLFLSFDDYLNHYYRHWYSTLYTATEYSCFAFVIGQIIQKKKIKFLIFFLSLLFIIFEIIYLFKIRFNVIDSVPIGVETILILLYAFYLFFEQFQKIETTYMYNNYWFWFVIGIIFYLSSSFFFNILGDIHLVAYWYLTYIFETIKNLLFVVGIIFLSKQQDLNKNSTTIPFLDVI